MNSRYGYKAIHGARVYELATADAVAEMMASVYPQPVKVRVCESLTADRLMSSDETLELADKAAALILEGEAA